MNLEFFQATDEIPDILWNYNEKDLVQILKSDVMSHKEERDIQEHIAQSLKQYDLLEVSLDEQ
ncbi:hypothetical protein BKP56_12705 [Marinilactibacillus sp. 15R]|uniref:hypothetical protein n=1 Tax=Marinilactibacillus sp. 15R TaxID=1911586 RepID=UPI00090A1EFB|nr:hypothetical protein [Marinilactibacillus sp. 15R]API90062.1 hypothetical protein BKP56_12705 [Marinilactibacillus sp. 15R]